MSHAPSGPYKSRLFNFLHQQSHKLRERSERTVRHVQVAAVWGVQILLYPIYLLAQSARFAGHQLQQAASQGWPSLDSSAQSKPQTPTPSDTPIKRVLNAVTILPIAAAEDKGIGGQGDSPAGSRIGSITNPQSSLPLISKKDPEFSNSQSVRGVASQLATRTLVLVTAENEILNVLTIEQQQKLSFRISWEIADYWRHRRLSQASKQQFCLLSAADDRQVLPAMRVFWQVMAWVQMGPVAIATNLFQESALVKSQQSVVRSPELDSIPVSSLILAPLSFLVEQLTLLDSTVAELEGKGLLLPASEITSALVSRSQRWLQRLQYRLDRASWQSTSREFSDASETEHRRIHSLIQAAVNYFFGDRGRELPLTNSSEPPMLAAHSKNKLQFGDDASSLDVGRKAGLLQLVNEGETERGIGKFHGLGKLRKGVSRLQQSPSPERPETADASRLNTIQSLIRAAINYFFGSPGGKLPSTGFSGQPTRFSHPQGDIKGRQFTSLPVNQHPVELEPWLSLGDLFGTPTTPTQEVVAPTNQFSQTLLSRTDATINYSIESQSLSKLSPGQINLRNIKRTSTKLTGHQRATPAVAKADLAKPVDANLNHVPEWIETQSTTVGYVKHPLEIVLAWLDSSMLWLEEMVVKVWQRVRHLR